MKHYSLIKKMLILLPILCGIGFYSLHGSLKLNNKWRIDGIDALAAAQDGAAAKASAADHATPEFSAEDLADLEIRAQAYINIGHVGVRLFLSRGDQFAVLQRMIPELNQHCMHRFLSFFKNKKNVAIDALLENKDFFQRIKQKLHKNAQHVFTMIERYNPKVLSEMQRDMVGLGNVFEDPSYKFTDAIGARHLDTIKKMVATGVNIMRCDETGRAPFHYAVLFQFVDVIELLIHSVDNKKTLVNLKNNNGEVPLLMVNADAQDVQILLEKHGANLNCADEQGATPLQTAIKAVGGVHGNRIVACLVAAKARVTQADLELAKRCLDECPAKNIQGKFAYATIIQLLEEKISQRIALEKKLAVLSAQKKTNANSGSAAAGTSSEAASSSAAAGGGCDAPKESNQKQALDKLERLTKNELAELELRAAAYLEVDSIQECVTPMGDFGNHQTLQLKDKMRMDMKKHQLFRFLSFFKMQGLTSATFVDKKNLQRIAKYVGEKAKIIINGILIKLDNHQEITQELYENAVIETDDIVRVVDCVCAKDYKKLSELAKTVDVNQCDSIFLAPMHYTVMLKDMKLAQVLVSAKADVNYLSMHGVSPLLLAHGFIDSEMNQYLVAQGAQLTADALHNAVINMATNKDLDKTVALCALLQRGVRPTRQTIDAALALYKDACLTAASPVKSLYEHILMLFGYPMRSYALTPLRQPGIVSMDGDLKTLVDKFNGDEKSRANALNIHGMRVDTKQLADIAMGAVGLNAIAQDKLAIERFVLSDEERQELEILAQAYLNGDAITRRTDLTLWKSHNPQMEFIRSTLFLTCGQMISLFNKFFFDRNISPEKFAFDDIRTALKAKVGAKAAQTIELINARLQKNKDKNAAEVRKPAFKADKKLLALNAALFAQDISAVNAHLKAGVDANGEDDMQYMPLFYAILSAYTNPLIADELIATLLKSGAKPLGTNFYGVMPMLLIDPEVALKHTAQFQTQITQASLDRAIHASKLNGPIELKALIAHGAKVSKKELELVDKLLLKAGRLPVTDASKDIAILNLSSVQTAIRDAMHMQKESDKKSKAAQDLAEQEELAKVRREAREKRDAANKERLKNEALAAQKRAEERERLDREIIAQALAIKEKAAQEEVDAQQNAAAAAAQEAHNKNTAAAPAQQRKTKKQLQAELIAAQKEHNRKQKEQEKAAADAARAAQATVAQKKEKRAPAKPARSQSASQPSKADAKKLAEQKAAQEAQAVEAKFKAARLAKEAAAQKALELKRAEDLRAQKEAADKIKAQEDERLEKQKQIDAEKKRAQDERVAKNWKEHLERQRSQREAQVAEQQRKLQIVQPMFNAHKGTYPDFRDPGCPYALKGDVLRWHDAHKIYAQAGQCAVCTAQGYVKPSREKAEKIQQTLIDTYQAQYRKDHPMTGLFAGMD